METTRVHQAAMNIIQAPIQDATKPALTVQKCSQKNGTTLTWTAAENELQSHSRNIFKQHKHEDEIHTMDA